jgi:2-O-methyltransferase
MKERIRRKLNFLKERIRREVFKKNFSLSIYKFYAKFRNIFSNKILSDITKKEIKALLKKDNPLILEIGCNNGKDSKEFLEEFNNIKLCCFEPDPRAISEFKKRINDNRCKLFEIGISDEKETKSFNLSRDVLDSRNLTGSSSLKKPKNHLVKFPNIEFNRVIKIKTDTLDGWAKKNNIKEIDFIWADVEGSERELILGGGKTLNNYTKYFYTEFRNEELFEGQPSLKEILKMIPNFKIIKIYGNNVLLANTKFV